MVCLVFFGIILGDAKREPFFAVFGLLSRVSPLGRDLELRSNKPAQARATPGGIRTVACCDLSTDQESAISFRTGSGWRSATGLLGRQSKENFVQFFHACGGMLWTSETTSHNAKLTLLRDGS